MEIHGLHLGSGDLYIPQFCNIDANMLSHCDIIANIEKLKIYSNTVSIVYASHVFEHIPKRKAEQVLSEWYRVLKKGGKLYICVPDNEALFKLYLENLPRYQTNEGRSIVDLSCIVIYGGQVNKYDYHYYGYSFATLSSMLLSVGFSKVQVFNRKEDGLFSFHDASFANINDIPVSLNIEATK
jgi:predicted SAM-dependent methyltransferase